MRLVTGPADGSIALNVTAVNDAPLATNLNQIIGYNEGDLSVAIANIVVSDVDTTETITAALTLGNSAYGALTVSGSATYTAGTGVWTITDTVTNVNAALAAVDFVPATNNDLNTSITTHIEDATGTEWPSDGSIALNVTPINDAPLATDLNQTIAYTEGDLSVAITDIIVSDVDAGETITRNLNVGRSNLRCVDHFRYRFLYSRVRVSVDHQRFRCQCEWCISSRGICPYYEQ